jgi:hypothetical protein
MLRGEPVLEDPKGASMERLGFGVSSASVEDGSEGTDVTSHIRVMRAQCPLPKCNRPAREWLGTNIPSARVLESGDVVHEGRDQRVLLRPMSSRDLESAPIRPQAIFEASLMRVNQAQCIEERRGDPITASSCRR